MQHNMICGRMFFKAFAAVLLCGNLDNGYAYLFECTVDVAWWLLFSCESFVLIMGH